MKLKIIIMSFLITLMMGITVFATVPSFPTGYSHFINYRAGVYNMFIATNSTFVIKDYVGFPLWRVVHTSDSLQFKTWKLVNNVWTSVPDSLSGDVLISQNGTTSSSEYQIFSSSHDLLFNSSVFFSPPKVTLLEGVKPNLQAMGGSLVSPVLLKVCVIVLSIVLGVQLVPRLIRSLV